MSQKKKKVNKPDYIGFEREKAELYKKGLSYLKFEKELKLLADKYNV